ncbi:hypothetical protein M2326_002924 [Flavobacterium sp. 7A]|nr:hypothetical protein [Flavobacterium sp. 7A]
MGIGTEYNSTLSATKVHVQAVGKKLLNKKTPLKNEVKIRK